MLTQVAPASDFPAVIVADIIWTASELPAFRAGVKIGDEIVALDQRPVSSPDEVLSFVRSTQPGDSVDVRVRRSGEVLDLVVVLCDFAKLVALR